jgi:MarR family transcriptional regulator, lower aerobic nicotinate degradation pathway regulator
MTTTPLEHDPDARVQGWDVRSLSPGMLLAKLGREAMRQFAEALKPTDLTPGHLTALHLLSGRALSQQALCEAVGVDPSKLVGLLNDLEEQGLVVRRRHPADRRRHIVEISERGKKRLAAAERAAASVEERLLAGLDATQRDELHRLLSLVVDNTPLHTCQPAAETTVEFQP